MTTLPTDRDWMFYGKDAPYFGVTGLDIHLSENLDSTVVKDFFNSGEEYVGDLFKLIRTSVYPDFSPKRILEHGCGPGRMVIPFGSRAEKVVATDISSDMLKEAKLNCERYNIRNATFLISDDTLHELHGEKFDLVHSFIVLQHLNIKRGIKIFRRLVEAVDTNGVGALHVTYHDDLAARRPVNYLRFRIPSLAFLLKFIKSILRGKKFKYYPQMQMNNYPLNTLMAILQKDGIEEVHMKMTNHYNYFGTIIIFRKMKP